MNRGVLYGWAGEIDAAEDDTRRALALFEQHGWTNAPRTCATTWPGSPPAAAISSRRSAASTTPSRRTSRSEPIGAAMYPDRSEALLAAGLDGRGRLPRRASGRPSCASTATRSTGRDLDARRPRALLAGDNDRAASASDEASALFAAQDRAGWWAAAASLNVEARLRAGSADAEDVERIDAVIEATQAAGLGPACAEARLVAAELAAERGEWERARGHLDAVDRAELGLAARCRLDLLRARGLAADGRDSDALAACAAAVDEFGELTAELGGTELRAHVALHVAELVGTGLELAVHRNDPWLAFDWSERQRATALASAPVRPPDDVELAADLDRLRAALTQLDADVRDGTRHGTVAQELTPESTLLQDRIRRRARLGRRAAAVATACGRGRGRDRGQPRRLGVVHRGRRPAGRAPRRRR